MLQALRLRDFRLLWAGSLVSSLGSWLLTIAIPAHVLLATGSLRDTGLTLAAEYLPLLNSANSLTSASSGIVRLIGGPLGGILLAACGIRTLICADSLSYVMAATALPGAVIIGTFGSMCLVIPQTAMQRLILDAVLGRVSALFLTGEAAATLAGAVAGPFLAQAAGAAGLETVAAVASLLTLAAAALARLTVPRIPVMRGDGELRSFLPNGPVVTPRRPPSSPSR